MRFLNNLLAASLLLLALAMLPPSPALAQNGNGEQYGAPNSSSHRNSASSWPKGLPADYQDFKQRYQSVAVTPEGAVKMYFDALYSYIDGNHSEALKMLRYSLHADKGWDRNSGYYATFVERLKDPSRYHIFRSFAKGSSPENDYAMSPRNYELMIDYTRDMGSYTQVALISSGADSPRIIQVQRFPDGLWYVTQNAASYVEVRPPASHTNRPSHDADFD